MTAWSDRAETLLAEATPGPWYAGEGVAAQDVNVWDQDGVPTRAVAQDIFDDADRALIAASRELVPLLVNVAKAADEVINGGLWPDEMKRPKIRKLAATLESLRAWGNDA